MEALTKTRHQSRLWPWVETLWQDLRFAVRLLFRSPGFAAAAVVCLAIGIGLTTGVYSELESLVFRDLPAISQPRQLVRFQTPMPFGNWKEFHSQPDPFTGLTAFRGPVPFVLSLRDGEPVRVWGHLAAPNYFEVLGVHPQQGRLFGPAEQPTGAGEVVVVSDRLWRAHFGGTASAIGRPVRINGHPLTIVGVAPKDFLGASPALAAADLWVPTTVPAGVAPELAHLDQSRAAAFDLIGRLRPDRTPAQAEAILEPQVRQLEQVYNDPGKDRKERRMILLPGGRLFPIRDEDMPKAMGLPVVLVALVLLMACNNVANMLIARGAARRREIAVRLSIGAGRARLVRQLLTESLILAIMGGIASLAVTHWWMHAFESFTASLPGYFHFEWRVSRQALVFSALVSVFSGVLFGVVPALDATRGGIAAGLKPAVPSRLRARRWFSLRNILVTQQVAASIVLLLLTGFVVIGFGNPGAVDLGFEHRHLYLLNVDPVREGYDAKRAADYFDRLPRRLALVPGVTAVAIAQTLPVAFSGIESAVSAKVEMLGGPQELGTIRSDRVGAGFLETAGIPVIRGRDFTNQDVANEAHVLVVNESMAKRVWPGQDPLGQWLEFNDQPQQVIGVARDIRPAQPLTPPAPAVYQPVLPSSFGVPSREGVTLVVRVRPGFDAATILRREIHDFDPSVTVFNVRRMQDLVDQVYYVARLATSIYGAMGVFALILAIVGLAGVTAYSVARRTHEIGIRIALGASSRDILRLVLGESVGIVAVGGAIGLALSWAVLHALNSLFETMAQVTRISASDPRLLAGAPGLLLVLALLACYFPALKSTRTDPTSALKAE